MRQLLGYVLIAAEQIATRVKFVSVVVSYLKHRLPKNIPHDSPMALHRLQRLILHTMEIILIVRQELTERHQQREANSSVARRASDAGAPTGAEPRRLSRYQPARMGHVKAA